MRKIIPNSDGHFRPLVERRFFRISTLNITGEPLCSTMSGSKGASIKVRPKDVNNKRNQVIDNLDLVETNTGYE